MLVQEFLRLVQTRPLRHSDQMVLGHQGRDGLVRVGDKAQVAIGQNAHQFGAFGDGNPWVHLGAHLVIGTTVGSLVPWLIGSVVLYATRKLAGSDGSINTVGIIAILTPR